MQQRFSLGPDDVRVQRVRVCGSATNVTKLVVSSGAYPFAASALLHGDHLVGAMPGLILGEEVAVVVDVELAGDVERVVALHDAPSHGHGAPE